MARPALSLAVAVLAATAACALPEAPQPEERTNALAAHGKPYPTQAPPQPGAPTVEIVAKVGPQYEQGALTAKVGVNNISFTSPEEGNHNVNLVGPGAPYPLLWGDPAGGPAKDLTKAVNLQRGTYTYYCSVPGHRSAGMQGTLTVA